MNKFIEYSIVVAIAIFCSQLISGFRNSKPPVKKELTEEEVKNFKNDTSGVMEAIYVTNGSNLGSTIGPVKRVVMATTLLSIDSVSELGKKILSQKRAIDTFYLIPDIDSTMLYMDSLKRPILDPKGNKQYQYSFRVAKLYNKAFVDPTTIYFPNVR